MTTSYIGQISIFAGTFAPRNWMFCQGQKMNLSTHTALFSILGTTYGGDGTSYFLLPDLRGRVAVSAGQGAGLSNYVLGQTGGYENITLTQAQMPIHNHNIQANNTPTLGVTTPSNNFLGVTHTGSGPSPSTSFTYSSNLPNSSSTTLNNASLTTSGQGTSHPNLQPLLAINFIICVNGVYPSRN